MTEEKEVISESNGQETTENVDKADEETELDSSIIRQVEHYFGDLNLPRDKFLMEQVKLDDGWVPLEILIKFHRLAKLSTDTEVIAKALNKSTSGLLEVSEDNKKVRRSPELPMPEMNEERRKELSQRTIYAKGFPKNSTLDEILAYFKQFDVVENIIMRKFQERQTKKKLFKGSIFATFKTKEQAEKFINTKDLKYQDNELIILWQEDYMQKKQEEYTSKKEQKEKKQKEKEVQMEKDELKLPTGTVLHFSEVNSTMKREDVKDALTELGADVAYIDFKVGDTEGWVRLSKENTAKDIADKMTDGKLKIGDTDVAFKVLEGEEERIFLEKTVEEMVKRRKNMKNFRNNKGKNYKGKQGKKRRQDKQEDEPPKKIKAS